MHAHTSAALSPPAAYAVTAMSASALGHALVHCTEGSDWSRAEVEGLMAQHARAVALLKPFFPTAPLRAFKQDGVKLQAVVAAAAAAAPPGAVRLPATGWQRTGRGMRLDAAQACDGCGLPAVQLKKCAGCKQRMYCRCERIKRLLRAPAWLTSAAKESWRQLHLPPCLPLAAAATAKCARGGRATSVSAVVLVRDCGGGTGQVLLLAPEAVAVPQRLAPALASPPMVNSAQWEHARHHLLPPASSCCTSPGSRIKHRAMGRCHVGTIAKQDGQVAGGGR